MGIEALDPRLVLSADFASASTSAHVHGEYDVIHVDGMDGHYHVHADGHAHFYGHSHDTAHSSFVVGAEDDVPPCPICGEFHGPGVHDQPLEASGITVESTSGTDDDIPPCPICGELHDPSIHAGHSHAHSHAHDHAYSAVETLDRETLRGLDISGYSGGPEAVARQFISEYSEMLGIPQDSQSSLSVIDTRFGLASTHVYFQQTYEGAVIQDALINVSMDAGGSIQTVSTSFVDHNGATSAKNLLDASAAVDLAHDFSGVEKTWAEGSRELVWAVQDDLTLEPVWEIMVHASEPFHHDLLAYVSAVDGSVSGVQNESAHAVGTGDVFYPNPIQTQGAQGGLADNNDATSPELEAQLVSVSLERLDEGTGLLIGDWVDLTLPGGKDVPHADEPSRVYEYDRDDYRFEEVVVYYAIDQAQSYIHSLGYDDDSGPTANGIRDFPTRVSAHWSDERNAFYSTFDDALRFGDAPDGVDFAEDADIILHEYGHAIQHFQNPNWGGGEMGAMGEGFADYLAASFFADVGDPDFQAEHAAAVGEWAVITALPGLRRVDGTKTYPEDLTGFVHQDGEIWSAALWEIRGELGRTLTDTLILESHYELAAGATMVDGALAILTADENLTGGVNATAIRTAFENRGILVPADDHGNDASSPTSISVPSSTVALVDYENDLDYFEFIAVEGATYEIETTVGLPGDTTLTLYSSDGTQQLAFDDDGGVDLGSRLVWTAPASLSYLLEVSGPVEGAVYELQIDAISEPTDDHANDVSSATPVAIPSVTSAELEVVGDVDAFAFDAESGSGYTVTLNTGSLESGQIQLVDVNGDILGVADGEGIVSLDAIPAAAQTFFVLVSGDSQGTYDLSVEAIVDDHGDAIADASAITFLPSVTPGELEFISDRDVFSFDGVAGTRYTIDMLLGTLLDSSLTLFDEVGTQLAFDDDSGAGLASRIEFQPSVNGTYFVEVAGYGDEFAGTYDLSIAIDDHGNSAVEATVISVPGTAFADIELEDDSDFFVFSAAAGETIEITADAGASGDSVLTLYDLDGATQLALSDDDGGTAGSRILWTAPADGNYFLGVEGTVAAPYLISIDSVAAPVDDHGDGTSVATNVTVPSLTAGAIDVANDVDVFSFPVIAGASYSVDVLSVTLVGAQLQILDGSDTEIVIGDESVTFVPAVTGTFHAIVSGGIQGTYELAVDRIPDDHGESIDVATPVSVASVTAGGIDYLSDHDMFSFSGVAGQIYNIEVIQGTVSDTVLRLFDETGLQITSDDDGGAGLAPRITWQAPADATYFVEVSAFEDDYTGTYDLSIGFDDHADVIDNATPLSVPGTADVSIESVNDRDIFVFSAVEGTTIEALIDDSATGDGALTLYAPDGTTALAYDDNGGTGSGARIVWTIATDGDYFLGVTGAVSSDPYALSINTVTAPLDDHGNVSATATAVTNPSLTSGTIEAASDVDAFAFDAIAGATYGAELVLGSLSSGDVTVIDPSGNVVGTAIDNVTFVPDQTGQYFVLVDGDSQGTYQLSVKTVPDDHGDALVDATSVVVPSSTTGEVEFQSDRDSFAFNAVAGVNYRFDVLLGTLPDSVLRLLNADGTQLAFDDNGGEDFASRIEWKPSLDGLYYIQVGGFADGEVGTYELSIVVDDHGDSSTSATDLVVPSTVDTQIESVGDVDYFRFTGVAGTVVEIVVDVALGDSVLTLFDADGVTALATNDNGGTDLGSRIVWAVDADQDYFVSVAGGPEVDPFQLSIDTITALADDHGDDESAATVVATPSTTLGILETSNDIDVFEFNTTAGASYSVAIVLDTLESATLTIVDDAGVPLAPVADGTTFLSEQTGVYRVFVDGASQGAYELTVEQIPDDHGDTSANATVLAVPGNANGELEFSADLDTFSFEATAGNYYDLEVVLDTLADSVIRLFDVDGTTELVSDDNGGEEMGSRLVWQAPADGTYFAQVGGVDSQVGTYELVVQVDDHGDTTDLASLIVVPGSASVQIDIEDDVDYFSFSTVAGQTLVLDVAVGVDGDSQLKLFNTDGVTLLAENDNNGTDAGSQIVWAVPVDGTYFLEVSGLVSTAPYTLDISAATTPLDDHGNQISTGTAVPTPSVTAGSLEVVGDVDAFSFSVVAGATYDVEVIPSTLENAQIEIKDPSGITITSASGVATFVADVTGDYHALISGNAQGDFELSVAKVPDDHGETFADATAAVSPAIIEGVIDFASDRDVFQVEAVAGGSYRFEVVLDTLSDSVLRLFDSDGAQLAIDDNGGVGMGSRIVWEPTVDGTFYLEVGGFNDVEVGSYELVAVADDHADTTAEASTLTVGGDVDALIEHSADLDVFQFAATAGDTLELLVDAGAGDSQLTLWDTDGTTQIAFDDDGGADAGSMIRWTVPASGTYYLGLQGSVSVDPYTVSATVITTPVDDIEDIEVLLNPGVTLAEIEVVNDTDTFAFDVTAGIIYRSRMILHSLGDGGFQIVDPDGVELFDIVAADGMAEVIWTAPATGTFTAVAYGTSQGTYQKSIQEIVDDHGDEPVASTLATLPGANPGWIEVPGDRDFFEFEAEVDLNYRFDALLNSLTDSVLRLYDNTGTQIEFDDSGGEGLSSRIVWRAPADGTYFVEVGGFDDVHVGDYVLVLTIDDHGNSAEDPTPLTIPGTIPVSIEGEGDVDFVSLPAVAGTTLEINVDAGADGDSVVTLYDTDGVTPLASNDDGGVDAGSQLVWTVPADGEYFVEVSGAVSDVYVLSVDEIAAPLDDHGNLSSTATSVLNPSETPGVLEVANDSDVFAFEVTAGASYNVAVLADTLESSQIVVTDDTGEVVGVNAEGLTFEAATTGTYFATVTGGSQGTYDFSVEKVPDDHGDSISDATATDVPGVVTGVLEYATDRDTFSFEAIAGISYQFEVVLTSLPDSVLRLFSDDGSQLALDVNGAGGFASQIVWQPPSAGTYYIQVGGNGDEFFGEYELLVAIADHGDTAAEATPLSVPAAIQAEIEPVDDRDFFSFDAVAGTTYEIRTTTPLPGDTTLSLYHGDGVTELAFDNNSGADDSSLILWTADTDQTYFIEVGVSSDSTEFVTPFDLSIASVATPDDDFGDSISDPMDLAVPSLTSGDLEVASDTDVFRVEVVTGSAYSVDVTTGTLESVGLIATDADGEVLSSATGSGSVTMSLAPLVDGTYFIFVDGASQGTYDLSVSEVPDDYGDAVADAAAVLTPSTTRGELEYGADRDTFAFAATGGEGYRLEVSPNSLVDSYLRLIDADAVTEIALDDDGGASTIVWRPTADGVYFLEVGGAVDSEGGTYELNVVIDDHGNAATGATSVGIPSQGTSLIENVDDNDFFSFVATADTTLEINVEAGGDGDSRLTLFDTDGVTQLAFNDDGGVDAGSQILWTVPADGTYYFEIAGEAVADPYLFNISAVATPLDDHGGQISTATAVATPSVTPGVLEVANDTDAFAFSATAGASFTVELLLSSLAKSQLVLLDDAGEVVDAGSEQITFVPAVTGTYYVIVEGESQGAYELSVEKVADDHGDSIADATVSSVPTRLVGELEFNSDRDVFEFDAFADFGYRFDVLLGTLGNSVLRLFNSSGTQLALDDNGGAGLASSIQWQAPADGTYYLQIDGFGNSFTGSYEIEATFPCDFVNPGDGCDIQDLDALYLGSHGAPAPLTTAAIVKWLGDASNPGNPLKPDPASVFVVGDVNLDGNVNSTDLGQLLNNFNDDSGLLWGGGNLNADASVNSSDLGLLLNNFGHTSLGVAAGFVSVAEVNEIDEISRSSVAAAPAFQSAMAVAPTDHLMGDANGDGVLSPIDALLVINAIEEGEIAAADSQWTDVDGDGVVAPVDALYIFNQLNGSSRSESAIHLIDEVDDEEEQDSNDALVDLIFAERESYEG